jgi:carboxyl-terminal processing protease
MTPEMVRSYDEQMSGGYAGIGAVIAARDGRFFLQEVFEGGAAAKAGLHAGDELLAVGGRDLAGLGMADVGRLLRGEAGTQVALSVRPGGEGQPREAALVRSWVRLPSVRGARLIEGEDGVGYLRLTVFKSGTEKELRQALRDLSDQGARAVVLDLRGNPGGELAEAVGAAGALLAGGRVARTRGRVLGATWTYDVPLLASPAWRGPLAVLVDEGTASAAEVLAAALAARGRATVVGRRPFGKGAAQINVPVSGASAVCVTVARVYDPKGACIESRGVGVDREVARPVSAPAALRDDAAVRAAIEWLHAAPAPPSARGEKGFP